MNRIVTFASVLVIVWIIGYLLIIGRGLLIPLVIAIFIWHLLNTIINGMERIPRIGPKLPTWVRMILSLVVVGIFCKILIDIISNNVADVIAVAPKYQENLSDIFTSIDAKFHIKGLTDFDSTFKNLSLQNIVVNIYGVFSIITSSAVLISLYVIFLFVEQHYFEQKLDSFFSQVEHRRLVKNIIGHITKDTQTYLGIKTLLSLGTSFASWMIMRWVHLDFAEFWALLIFFLNYIPNMSQI